MSELTNLLAVSAMAAAVLMTSVLGVHAYYMHRRESEKRVSPRKWMFWLYSAVFLVASAAGFAQLWVAVVFRDIRRPSPEIAYACLLLALSYGVLIAGVRKSPSVG